MRKYNYEEIKQKYNFAVYYCSDNNDYHISKSVQFYNYKNDNFKYSIQLSYTNKRYNDENYIIDIDSLEDIQNTINKQIEEKKKSLKSLKTNVNKFNKLMDKLEEFYNINDDFKYIFEVKEW